MSVSRSHSGTGSCGACGASLAEMGPCCPSCGAEGFEVAGPLRPATEAPSIAGARIAHRSAPMTGQLEDLYPSPPGFGSRAPTSRPPGTGNWSRVESRQSPQPREKTAEAPSAPVPPNAVPAGEPRTQRTAAESSSGNGTPRHERVEGTRPTALEPRTSRPRNEPPPPPVRREPSRQRRAPAPTPGMPPPGMIRISGGPALLGVERDRREVPEFHIDARPVTNTEYVAFAESTGAEVPEHMLVHGFMEKKADHPVVGVDFRDALRYARWCGKDLPTEDEWEKAARGTDGRVYPWGNQFDPGRCLTAVNKRQDTGPVGHYLSGASPYEVLDMAGGCWEWTLTPAGSPGTLLVVKGGSWFDPPGLARLDGRFTARPDFRSATLGFRCVFRPEALRATIPDGVKRLYAERRHEEESRAREAAGRTEEWTSFVAGVHDAGEAAIVRSQLERWDVEEALQVAASVLDSDEEVLQAEHREALLENAARAADQGRPREARRWLEQFRALEGDTPRARDIELAIDVLEAVPDLAIGAVRQTQPPRNHLLIGLATLNVLLFALHLLL
ncbi:MAG: SUMF1/EgtB/PvdO family nonheme iron enzyme [Planctomycetes bacterium]|nr:SUMF1/EgtB/PvdO family nonheme iron enzyme [Planctomycetota bacterium]